MSLMHGLVLLLVDGCIRNARGERYTRVFSAGEPNATPLIVSVTSFGRAEVASQSLTTLDRPDAFDVETASGSVDACSGSEQTDWDWPTAMLAKRLRLPLLGLFFATRFTTFWAEKNLYTRDRHLRESVGSPTIWKQPAMHGTNAHQCLK
ncbi:hypothetical protein DFS34DRAFT_326462 [Phlyctochytrium arcticum]|nr:hypothetical protein DFS34DRAFT_326462 [Phlyctochytrium arcticum]